MNRLYFVAVAAALTSGAALAADLPSRKGPPMLPPPPPPPLWTGFYVGLNAGGTWANSNTISTVGAPLFANPLLLVQTNNYAFESALGATSSSTIGSNGGFIGGGQVGYNWQFYNSFLVGFEADIQGVASSSARRSFASVVPDAIFGFNAAVATAGNVSRSLDYIGTVRGRLGWLATPTLLIYGTGGLAYGGVSSQTAISQQVVGPAAGTIGAPYFGAGAFSDTRTGWTAGGGVEWMFWPNWSAKVEYLYYDLGNLTYNSSGLANVVAPPGGVVPTGAIWSAAATQTSTHFNGNIVRAGLNYHFNWGAPAPVVAKY
jgi:outer membrane immunogenic protein